MHASTTAIDGRSVACRQQMRGRSTALPGIDGRTTPARRFRALVNEFAAEFRTQPGPRELLLIRQVAALTVRCEQLQADIISGRQVDLDQLVRFSNLASRLLKELGLKAAGSLPEQGPSLAAIIARHQAEEAA